MRDGLVIAGCLEESRSGWPLLFQLVVRFEQVFRAGDFLVECRVSFISPRPTSLR